MLSIFKENTVHKFMLAFSAPFECFILLHYLIFPLIRVTQAYDHVTSHPWGLHIKIK